MYDEPDYARSRLEGTVVLLNGKAVYVGDVYGDMYCDVYLDLNEGVCERVAVDDLQVLAPPLGFVNLRNKAAYLSRKPLREDWRQGLRPNQIVDLSGNLKPRELDSKLIMNCVNGQFFNLHVAQDSIGHGAKSVAISRDFCVSGDKGGLELIYKWYGKVGEVWSGKVNLDKEWLHLKSLLGVFCA